MIASLEAYIKAMTPKSTAYEYYTPDHRDEVEPIQIQVKSRGVSG